MLPFLFIDFFNDVCFDKDIEKYPELSYALLVGYMLEEKLKDTDIPKFEIEKLFEDYAEQLCKNAETNELENALSDLLALDSSGIVKNDYHNYVSNELNNRNDSLQSDQNLKDEYNRTATDNMRSGR